MDHALIAQLTVDVVSQPTSKDRLAMTDDALDILRADGLKAEALWLLHRLKSVGTLRLDSFRPRWERVHGWARGEKP